MKIKNLIYTAVLAASAALTTTGCVSDLDQYPHTETTDQNVYTSADGYRSVLGKIYTSMVVNGQGKGGNNADLSSNMGYDYMRCYFNLQECGTDEIGSTWLSGDKTGDISYLQWDANDPWVQDMYYRIYYNITLCNEFVRNCNSGSLSSDPTVQQYKAEARFMRALFYWHVLDLYRNGPFVTENDPVGSYTPPRYSSQQLFDYILSELNDCKDQLPSHSGNTYYGRATKAAASTLKAKLLLNAEVYTGVARYAECKQACADAISEMGATAGGKLAASYAQLFNADNDKRYDEIIFALPQDADNTVSWGGTTYIICGQVSNTSVDQKPANYGVESGWGMFRMRGELVDVFSKNLATGDNDQRAMFFTTNQSKDMDDMTDQSQGYFSEKWTNLTDDSLTASNTADGGANTDFPLFRLADVYLMEAECMVRLHEDWVPAVDLLNMVRRRAGITTDVKYTDFKTDDEMLQFILDERARELYLEAQRRTDLIRFGVFTTSKYLWQWKGGVKDGQAVASKYNYYPIPTTELTANPNLYNEEY